MKGLAQNPNGILSFAGPYRGKFTACVCELLVSGVLNIATYLVIADIFTKIFFGIPLASNYILLAALLILMFMLTKNGLEYLGLDLSHVVAYGILADLRQALAQKFLKIPMGSLRNRGHGDIKKSLWTMLKKWNCFWRT